MRDEKLFQDYTAHRPGIAALLLRDGQAVYSHTSGMADLERHIPATLASNYRLASVSKQFTAMAILLLVADGRLSLDDRLASFFAHAPQLWQHITLEQLLSHTSGLYDYEDLIALGTRQQLTTADVLTLIRPCTDGYERPGACFRYSNTGYCLLALIVEQLADMPFAAFLRERIFVPLGMSASSAFLVDGPDIPCRAYGYCYNQQQSSWQLCDQSLTSATLGDGGIYSSVRDLAHWDAALASGQLLPARLQERMFSPHVITPSGEAYGLGWYLRLPKIAYHTGETIGFRTALVRRLDRRLTAIVLTNRNEANPLVIADHMLNGELRNSAGLVG